MIGLYAIVSEVPQGLRDAEGAPLRAVNAGALIALVGGPSPEVSPEALRAHDAAVRKIAASVEACLPARFGATAEDEPALLAELKDREADLRAALELVRGREQMTLRIHGPPATKAPSRGKPGTRYLEERKRAATLPELEPLRAALSQLVRAEKVERSEALLASVYHLVDRGSAGAYARIVSGTSLDGLEVKVSGPWPAWSFAP